MNGPYKSVFWILLLVICFATVIHWLILIMGIPIFDNLPYWKYTLRYKAIDHFWIFIALALLGSALFVGTSSTSLKSKLVLLILIGTTMQYSFAFSKGQGLDGIRERMVSSGHAEFAKAAVEQPGGMLWVAQNYEEVAAKKKYGYIGSKPPGTFLFYMAFEIMSEVLYPANDHVERLENLRTFASLTWPLLSYLVIIPLFFLAREITNDIKTALLVCILYIAIPSVNLITLHTDQVVYPSLVVLMVLVAIIAYKKGELWLSLFCGAIFYVAVYFSFGLAVTGVLFLLPALNTMSINTDFPKRRFSKYAAGIAFGFLLFHIFTFLILKYDIVTRYNNAWVNHIAWKGWDDNLQTYTAAGFTNIIEFSLWVGIPLAILFTLGFYDSLRQFKIRKPDTPSILNLLLVGLFVFLLVFGKTKAEVARLWLFLVPFICISAANFIQRQRWSYRDKRIFMLAALILEVGTTYFILHYQDFS